MGLKTSLEKGLTKHNRSSRPFTPSAEGMKGNAEVIANREATLNGGNALPFSTDRNKILYIDCRYVSSPLIPISKLKEKHTI